MWDNSTPTHLICRHAQTRARFSGAQAQTRTHFSVVQATSTITHLPGHINTSLELFPNQLTGLMTHQANTMVYLPWLKTSLKHIRRPTHWICAHAQTRTHFTSTITH